MVGMMVSQMAASMVVYLESKTVALLVAQWVVQMAALSGRQKADSLGDSMVALLAFQKAALMDMPMAEWTAVY